MEETKFTRWRYTSKVFQKRFWFHVRDDLDDCFSYSCKERISRKSSSRRSTHKASEYKINWIQEPRVWFYITLKYISPNFSYFYFLFSFFFHFFFHIFFHIFFFFFIYFFFKFHAGEWNFMCVYIFFVEQELRKDLADLYDKGWLTFQIRCCFRKKNICELRNIFIIRFLLFY